MTIGTLYDIIKIDLTALNVIAAPDPITDNGSRTIVNAAHDQIRGYGGTGRSAGFRQRYYSGVFTAAVKKQWVDISEFAKKDIMNFLCFGDKNNKSILFIHGMASTAMLCYEPILKRLSDYYVILAEVDGHSDRSGELVNLEKCCDEIEKYITDNLLGNLYCLSGFSMGATMAVEIIGRGNVNVAKTHLDAAFLIKMGLLTKPYEYMFCKMVKRIQNGKAIPQFIMDAVMGKDNNSILEMFYLNITSNTVKNACEFVYRYNIPENIRSYKGTVLFWRGSNERYPRKSVALLKKYLSAIIDVEIENMGHGQYLHEHSDEYASKLIEYLQS